MRRVYGTLFTLALGLVSGCHRQSASPGEASPQVRRGGSDSAGQSLSTEQAALPKATQVEQLLQGRFAGVEVLPTRSGGFLVRIRGATSLTGSTEPLYVVNGVAVLVDPERGLDWLDPAQIERIEVIKDAAELALYGGRGANGVIRITTKGYR